MFKKYWQKLLNNYYQLNKKQKILFTVFFIALVAATAAFSVLSYQHFSQKRNEEVEILDQLNADILSTLDDSQIEDNDKKKLNILLLGYGGVGHQGGMLADVIQIAQLNFEQKTLSFISVPRDLELKLNNNYQKINSIFSSNMTGKEPIISAGQVSKKTLSLITGLNIKYFIAVDFVGFQRLIGKELGGIEIEVAQDFEDKWYPIEGKQLDPCGYSNDEIAHLTATLSGFNLESQFACRYERIYFPAGLQKMEGGDALKYVRSRHSSSDFDRSRRQVEVMSGIRKKLFDLKALSKIPQFFKQVSQHVYTDFDLESLQYFAPLLINANDFQIKNINLSTENVLNAGTSSNGSVLIPKAGRDNWGGLQVFLQESLNN
jgi:anionic cell wall polymer biosynthesis LytR-Cps2A-Psr (LCP) family protein